METSYEEQLKWLFNQFPAYQHKGVKAFKPTLENTKKLLSRLGNPERNLKFVHVAGSNGKGSTCSYIASVLFESGYKTGLFTSPHLLDFRERIRVNGNMIDESWVHGFIDWIRSEELDFDPSFFEVSFCMALKHFENSSCDICVIETGLGGRLDSTNIISPSVSVITSISLDHQNILGDTIELIATEKAGIIKPSTPVVTCQQKKTVLNILKNFCKNHHSTLYTTHVYDELEEEFPFLPPYQYENLAMSFKTLQVLQKQGFQFNSETWKKGIENVSLNTGLLGRFQILNKEPLLIFDVAHNVDGLNKLIRHVASLPHRTLRIVYSTSADKNLIFILKQLPTNATYYLSQFSNERGMDLHLLERHFNSNNMHVCSYSSPISALTQAMKDSSTQDIILATGSFFLLSDLFEYMQSEQIG